MVTAAAQVVFMLGHPVSGTAMPGRFNRLAGDAGLDRVMVPLDLDAAGLRAVIAGLRGMANVPGAVVTAPWKQLALDLVDEASATARLAGAVNVIRRAPDGRLHGENTDGGGFLAALAGHAVTPRGLRTLVIGAGGAGSAIAAGLVAAGATVSVSDLDRTRAVALAARIGAEAVPPPGSLEGFGLVVNATDVGHDGIALPHPLTGLDAQALVADVIAAPEITPFLARARDLGARIQTGAEMSAGQLPLVLDLLGLRSDS